MILTVTVILVAANEVVSPDNVIVEETDVLVVQPLSGTEEPGEALAGNVGAFKSTPLGSANTVRVPVPANALRVTAPLEVMPVAAAIAPVLLI